ncbi:MAG: tetratricopeptide repeat protein [Bdellovibrionales bacterium]
MTDPHLFQEVEEDLERQKLEALWKKYGFWIIVAALGIVLSTASSTAYRSWKASHDAKVTTAFLFASRLLPDTSKNIEALQKFAEENAKESHAALALLRAGSLALRHNDRSKAIEFFDKVAIDTQADPAVRQLGALLSVQAQLDTGASAELAARLQPLADEDSAWRFSAREMQGYVALRAGDRAQARKIFIPLSQDVRAPRSIAQRAADILRTLN